MYYHHRYMYRARTPSWPRCLDTVYVYVQYRYSYRGTCTSHYGTCTSHYRCNRSGTTTTRELPRGRCLLGAGQQEDLGPARKKPAAPEQPQKQWYAASSGVWSGHGTRRLCHTGRWQPRRVHLPLQQWGALESVRSPIRRTSY